MIFGALPRDLVFFAGLKGWLAQEDRLIFPNALRGDLNLSPLRTPRIWKILAFGRFGYVEVRFAD
jgi:hypothetical protein